MNGFSFLLEKEMGRKSIGVLEFYFATLLVLKRRNYCIELDLQLQLNHYLSQREAAHQLAWSRFINTWETWKQYTP